MAKPYFRLLRRLDDLSSRNSYENMVPRVYSTIYSSFLTFFDILGNVLFATKTGL
jgi:hypothetical protein